MERSARFAEIDLLRAAAIGMMIVYHTAFDLAWFYGWNISLFTGGWKLLACITATLFLLLVGISAVLLRNSLLLKGASRFAIQMRFVRRGLWVLVCAMAISLVTLVVDPVTYVRFGILHLIGTSILLLPILLGFGAWNVVVAVPIVMSTYWLTQPHVASALLLPLGVFGPTFASVDYFPLAPWFGVVLIGAGIGHLLYIKPAPLSSQNARLRIYIDRFGETGLGKLLVLPGRHSLLLYLVHQPIVLAILWIFLGKPQ